MTATPAPTPEEADETLTDADPHRDAREQIITGSAFDAPFVVMNVLATLIACYGLLENSAAIVIGAMLIAMLMGPIAGIALALVAGDSRLLTRSLGAEVAGVMLVLLVSFVLGKIHRALPIGSQILSRTSPNIMDLLIALASGAAGAYATLTPRLRASLVGVAISTALVPPLSVCGICLARGETSLAWGGFLLFFANFIAIQFAFSVVLVVFGLYRTREDKRASRRKALGRQGVSMALLLALAVILWNSFAQNVARQRQDAAIRAALTRGLRSYPGAQLADLSFSRDKRAVRVTAIVRASGAVSPAKVAVLQAELPVEKNQTVRLQVRSVITKTATAQDYVDDSQEAVPLASPNDQAAPSGTDTSPSVPDTSP